MKNLLKSLPALIVAGFAACSQPSEVKEKNTQDSVSNIQSNNSNAVAKDTPIADAATILARREVPILCYHQIREWRAGDPKDMIIPPANFRDQLKVLYDSGYHTILPDQLYAYLTKGTPLPDKPVMLTYDDTDIDQYTVAAPEMKKYGFKGVYFIMTVSINRPPRYMSKEQLQELAKDGHVIESHTWNHTRVPAYKTDEDWATQIDKPKKQIEEMTGRPSNYFAYPYGLWNKEAIPELKKHGVKAAYILSTKRDENDPLYTIRRMIGSGTWNGQAMYRSMIKTFHLDNSSEAVAKP